MRCREPVYENTFRGWATKIIQVQDSNENLRGLDLREEPWEDNLGRVIGVKFPSPKPRYFAKFGHYILEQRKDDVTITQVINEAQANFMKSQMEKQK